MSDAISADEALRLVGVDTSIPDAYTPPPIEREKDGDAERAPPTKNTCLC